MSAQIVDADTKSGTVTSNTQVWTLTYPTNLQAGDLIIALIARDNATTVETATWPAGWVPAQRAYASSAGVLHFAKKLSDGTETGTFTVDVGASEQGSWRIFRITDWYGTIGTTFENLAGGGSVVWNTAAGTSGFPVVVSALNPINWGTEETLWIAICGINTSRTISGYPSNFPDRNVADVSGGSNGSTLATATAVSAVSQLAMNTPGFTASASDDWAASIIAIRPLRVLPPVIKNLSQDVNRAAVI